MKNNPYVYSEDSKLLGDYLVTLEEADSFLEIGAGGGGNLLRAEKSRLFDSIVGTDLSSLVSLRKQLPRSIELITTDRASCFRPSSFDLIAFNPPYLPSEGVEDLAVDGGAGGIEIPLKFLEGAISVLRADGKVVMLLSSEDSIEELNSFCKKENLLFKKVAESNLFFESLFVFLITRK